MLPEMGTSTQQWKNTVIERNKEEEKIKVKTHHAKWVNCESTEHAMTCVLIVSNSLTLSLNAMISVGHTNVLKKNKNKDYKEKCLTYILYLY